MNFAETKYSTDCLYILINLFFNDVNQSRTIYIFIFNILCTIIINIKILK
jgi:hypothetical protein